MNLFRFTIVSLFVLLILFMFAIPEPEIREELKNVDLPWNIKLHEDGSSEVFSLRIGTATLADGIGRFGEPEGIAIYLGDELGTPTSSLESYFGTVHIGPLKAKLVLTLDANQAAIEDMLSRATGRAMSGSEDRKIELSATDRQASLDKAISGITFIPNYGGLESDFFKQRFGEPQAWLRLNENAVQYFYPDRGLSITIDADGKEILQYSDPRLFKVPDDAELNRLDG